MSMPAGDGYEFSPAQNETIGGLARSMRTFGVLMVLFGVLQLVGGAIQRDVVALAQGILLGVVGGLTVKAGAAFRGIVDSAGSDLRHLMDALTTLHGLYRFQVMVVVAALGVGVLVALLGPTARP